MKNASIQNNPDLVRKLANQALGKQQFVRRRELAILIKKRHETVNMIEAIWRLRAERRGKLSLIVTDNRGKVLTIENSEAVSNVLDYLERFLESRKDLLDRWINSFEV